eukprot:1179145-Prorocentrum_minimum.AAC.3
MPRGVKRKDLVMRPRLAERAAGGGGSPNRVLTEKNRHVADTHTMSITAEGVVGPCAWWRIALCLA